MPVLYRGSAVPKGSIELEQEMFVKNFVETQLRTGSTLYSGID